MGSQKHSENKVTAFNQPLPSVFDQTLPQPEGFKDFLLPGQPKTSLVQLRKSGKAVPIMSAMLTGLANSLGTDLPPARAIAIAGDFLRDLGPYPLEDVVLFLKQVSRGEYGKFYGKISYADLMIMWREYDERRLRFIHQNHEREKKELNGDWEVKGETSSLGLKPRTREKREPVRIKQMESTEDVLRHLYRWPEDKIQAWKEARE